MVGCYCTLHLGDSHAMKQRDLVVKLNSMACGISHKMSPIPSCTAAGCICLSTQAVRHDPAERAALEARLKVYEDAELPAREAREALLVANKQQACTLTADVRLHTLQQEATARQERIKLVRAAGLH